MTLFLFLFQILFRYAIAFFKHKENELLAVNDCSEMHLYLRSLGQKMIDVNKVSKVKYVLTLYVGFFSNREYLYVCLLAYKTEWFSKD